jgi:hypothetical protein
MFDIISTAHAQADITLSHNPMEWNLALWVFIFIFSLPGGFANWVTHNVQNGWAWSWRGVLALMKDIMCSASVAVISFMTVITQTDDLLFAAIGSGVCAHLAPRIIFSGNSLLEIGTNKYIRKIDPDAKIDPMPDAVFTREQVEELIKQAIEKNKSGLLDK